MLSKLFSFVFVLGLLLTGCGGDDDSGGPTSTGGDDPPDNPTFAADIQPILTANCAVSGCHNLTAQAGLNLSLGVAHNNTVGVTSTEVPSLKRIVAGNSNNSFLVKKIEGIQSSGTRMPPPPRSALSSAQINTIKTWIDAGALDN